MASKKDYELIAEAIKDVGVFYHLDGEPMRSDAGVVLFSVAMELARELGAANPRFDKQRFLAACEVGA